MNQSNPKCVSSCPTIAIDGMCVKTCRPTYFLDKEKKQCIEQCPDKDTDYID